MLVLFSSRSLLQRTVLLAAAFSLQNVPVSAQTPALLIAPFAVADGSASPSPASVCPGTEKTVEDVTDADRVALLNTLATELQARLSKGTPTQVAPPAEPFPEGAVVLGACLTRIDAGNAKMRVVGAGMGASVLAAHVTVSQSRGGKLVPVQIFDEEAKGRNFGVGSGMLINAMRAHRTSLDGDAASLADKIAKAYSKHEGAITPAK